jgi:hypothetical protein
LSNARMRSTRMLSMMMRRMGRRRRRMGRSRE